MAPLGTGVRRHRRVCLRLYGTRARGVKGGSASEVKHYRLGDPLADEGARHGAAGRLVQQSTRRRESAARRGRLLRSPPMSPALQTVLEIAGVGSTLLFLALTGLIGLMYALTSSWLHERLTPRPAGEGAARTGSGAPDAVADGAAGRVASVPGETLSAEETAAGRAREEAEAELDRRLRAVALAVAVARADVQQASLRLRRPASEPPSDWRRVHRLRRLSKPRARARTRA